MRYAIKWGKGLDTLYVRTCMSGSLDRARKPKNDLIPFNRMNVLGMRECAAV